jgi:hypothetical protein
MRMQSKHKTLASCTTVSMLAAALALTACDSKHTGASGSAGSQQASAGTTAPQDTSDEDFALNQPSFKAPVVLHFAPDNNDIAQQLANMHGVSTKATNGAVYEQNAFLPCPANQSQPESFLVTIEGITGTQVDSQTFTNWLRNHDFIENVSYPITFTNTTFNPPMGGNVVTYTCTDVADAIRQYLAPDQRTVDTHHGLFVTFAQRAFSAWTFRNRYTAQTGDRGNVPIFAGTFSYTMQSTLPGVGFQGQGTGTVKLMHDPDNGQWSVVSYSLNDPEMALR